MSADYEGARARLARMLDNLTADDDGSVTLLYPLTVADYEGGAQAVLGVITDGELVALAEHRCVPDQLATLRAEVLALREKARKKAEALQRSPDYDYDDDFASLRSRWAKARSYSRVLDLIDKLVQQTARP